jgi:hypothetical protein
MTPRKAADSDKAVQRLHDAAASGLPRADWVRHLGINNRALNAWRVILERKGASRPAPPLRLSELVPRSNPPSTAEVRVR